MDNIWTMTDVRRVISGHRENFSVLLTRNPEPIDIDALVGDGFHVIDVRHAEVDSRLPPRDKHLMLVLTVKELETGRLTLVNLPMMEVVMQATSMFITNDGNLGHLKSDYKDRIRLMDGKIVLKH